MCTPFGKMQNDFHDARVVGGSPSLCENCEQVVRRAEAKKRNCVAFKCVPLN